MSSQIFVWDFTADCNKVDKATLDRLLLDKAKRWVYQKEKGERTGYVHFQGRLSLKSKMRKTAVVLAFDSLPISWSPTSETVARAKDFSYVMKSETRLEGPWSDETDAAAPYIPRQVREIEALYPWQQTVVDSGPVWDTRTVNVLIDTTGNNGKSILKTWIGCKGLGRAIPFCNDYRDILRMVMDTPKVPLYIVDIPRALRKDQLFQFFAAIETLKDGHAYDDRYHFREEYFDSPTVWVFMNIVPDTSLLSKDRWKFWEINAVTKDLRKYIPVVTEKSSSPADDLSDPWTLTS